MKHLSFILCLFLFGCGTNDSSTNADSIASAPKQQEPIDTTYFFVRRILNHSPKEVQKVLGKPDGKIKATRDADYLPNDGSVLEATYESGKYDLLYYKNELKYVDIVVNSKDVGEISIQKIGFPAHSPSWITKDNRGNVINYQWRSHEIKNTSGIPYEDIIPGIREITAVNMDDGTYEIIVCVMTDFNKGF